MAEERWYSRTDSWGMLRVSWSGRKKQNAEEMEMEAVEI